MRLKRTLLLAGILAALLAVSVAGLASAAAAPYPAVSVVGSVGFQRTGVEAHASFSARAVGPAVNVDEHQPARGSLLYRDDNGMWFVASVEHIHAHDANEVHFGGLITRASDPALVGMQAMAAAVDGAQGGGKADLFSLVIAAAGTHDHGSPALIEWGNLVVRSPF